MPPWASPIGPDGAPITTIPFPEEFSGPTRIRGAVAGGADGNLLRQVELDADRRLVGFGAGAVYMARSDEDELQ